MRHEGAIYCALTTPTGRFYVGQTVRRIVDQEKAHWRQRAYCDDRLHLALQEDLDPMVFIFLPLE